MVARRIGASAAVVVFLLAVQISSVRPAPHKNDRSSRSGRSLAWPWALQPRPWAPRAPRPWESRPALRAATPYWQLPLLTPRPPAAIYSRYPSSVLSRPPLFSLEGDRRVVFRTTTARPENFPSWMLRTTQRGPVYDLVESVNSNALPEVKLHRPVVFRRPVSLPIRPQIGLDKKYSIAYSVPLVWVVRQQQDQTPTPVIIPQFRRDELLSPWPHASTLPPVLTSTDQFAITTVIAGEATSTTTDGYVLGSAATFPDFSSADSTTIVGSSSVRVSAKDVTSTVAVGDGAWASTTETTPCAHATSTEPLTTLSALSYREADPSQEPPTTVTTPPVTSAPLTTTEVLDTVAIEINESETPSPATETGAPLPFSHSTMAAEAETEFPVARTTVGVALGDSQGSGTTTLSPLVLAPVTAAPLPAEAATQFDRGVTTAQFGPSAHVETWTEYFSTHAALDSTTTEYTEIPATRDAITTWISTTDGNLDLTYTSTETPTLQYSDVPLTTTETPTWQYSYIPHTTTETPTWPTEEATDAYSTTESSTTPFTSAHADDYSSPGVTTTAASVSGFTNTDVLEEADAAPRGTTEVGDVTGEPLDAQGSTPPVERSTALGLELSGTTTSIPTTTADPFTGNSLAGDGDATSRRSSQPTSESSWAFLMPTALPWATRAPGSAAPALPQPAAIDYNYYDGVAVEDTSVLYPAGYEEYGSEADYLSDLGSRQRLPLKPPAVSDTKGLEIASLVREAPKLPADSLPRRSDVLIEEDGDDDDDENVQSNDVNAVGWGTFEGQMLRRMVPLVARRLRSGGVAPQDVDRLRYIFGSLWPEVEHLARAQRRRSAPTQNSGSIVRGRALLDYHYDDNYDEYLSDNSDDYETSADETGTTESAGTRPSEEVEDHGDDETTTDEEYDEYE